MRVLVDLFPCQTLYRHRGIGRFALSLTREMAAQRGNHELTVLADALYPQSFEELRQQFIRLLPAGAFVPYYHEPLKDVAPQNADAYSRLAGALIEQAYEVVGPDVILTPNLFETTGGVEQGMVPLPTGSLPGIGRAVILYDLIPHIFHAQYLDPYPPTRQWYLERMKALHDFDLVLAISEATRQDAINLIGLKPENVVTIMGAASSHFSKLDFADDERRAWLQRLGISRPFVLYVGGDDVRKNMHGALRGFARLPRELTSSHQLVLNDVGDQALFRSKARSLGLVDDDLVIIKRFTDEELQALYNLCRLFVFPSLYEGLGLPILEAMTCGAPVIASNNSSLPEVVGRADALFDASSDESVASAIQRALTDDAYRSDLADYGPGRAAQFTWQQSARLAWDALQRLHEAKRLPSHPPVAAPADQPLMRIAYVSPLPPQKSGVAEYGAALLPHLAALFDIDLFVEPGLQVSDGFLVDNLPILSWTELPARRDNYDAIVYQMGNSEFHISIADLLQQVPGIVVSHDFFASGAAYMKEVRSGERGVFSSEMDDSHGLRGVVDYLKGGIGSAVRDWPLNWKVLRYAQELVGHSPHQNQLMREYFGHGWYPRPTIIRQIRANPRLPTPSEREALRSELDLPLKAFIFCSLGLMAHTKSNNLAIEALARLNSLQEEKTLLVFVGPWAGGEYGQETMRLIEQHGLNRQVIITGYKYQQEYEKYLGCADAAIQLRRDSRGETSRAVLDSMAFGVPTIVNAHGSLNDYEDADVVKLSESPDVEELAQAMSKLCSDAEYRAEKGRRAREYIIAEHNPGKIAAAYAGVIVSAARTKERELFSAAADALLALGSPPALMQSTSKRAAANLSLRCQPRILLDLTGYEAADLEDADRQSVGEIVRGMFSIGDKAVHVELIRSEHGSLHRASRIAESILGLTEGSVGPELPMAALPGDVLVLLDYLLPRAGQTPAPIEGIRQKGGRIITMVHQLSNRLLASPAIESDLFLCNSIETAEAVSAYFDYHEIQPGHPIDFFYPRQDGIVPAAEAHTSYGAIDPEPGAREATAAPGPARNRQEQAIWMLDLIEGGKYLHCLPRSAATDRVQNQTQDSLKSAAGASKDAALSAELDA